MELKYEEKLLDKGYIRFIEGWGSDQSVIEAARMSTDKGFLGWGRDGCLTCDTSWELMPQCPECGKPTTKVSVGDEKLLAYLYKNRHMTPFEMAGMIIEVKAPIMVYREWHRHRTQSYNEMSARYVPLPNENYLPDVQDLLERSAAAAATANRQASSSGKVLDLETALKDLDALADYYHVGQMLYEQFLDHGWPKELARLVTTVGRYSRMRASANLRNWMAFMDLRSTGKNPHAQKEIRVYADALGRGLQHAFPRTIALFNS